MDKGHIRTCFRYAKDQAADIRTQSDAAKAMCAEVEKNIDKQCQDWVERLER